MCNLIFLPFLMQVPAIQQKRTVAFLNQFVVHTVQFLNRFSTVCEEVCLLFSQLALDTIKNNSRNGNHSFKRFGCSNTGSLNQKCSLLSVEGFSLVSA